MMAMYVNRCRNRRVAVCAHDMVRVHMAAQRFFNVQLHGRPRPHARPPPPSPVVPHRESASPPPPRLLLPPPPRTTPTQLRSSPPHPPPHGRHPSARPPPPDRPQTRSCPGQTLADTRRLPPAVERWSAGRRRLSRTADLRAHVMAGSGRWVGNGKNSRDPTPMAMRRMG